MSPGAVAGRGAVAGWGAAMRSGSADRGAGMSPGAAGRGAGMSPGAGTSMLARIAGAPISWGVCEVPGWGHQLRPRRVLAEMRDAGLAACEFGPDGFLPAEPAARAELLAGFGLAAVGGFVPVVLHDPDADPAPLV